MDLVQKVYRFGRAAPRLNKLSGGDWKKTKARAKALSENMAEELVKLTAERQIQQGHAFAPRYRVAARIRKRCFLMWRLKIQLRCVEEIKADNELPWPMDRLLCGDVGFGKTEIAARAIFKCVMDGKQAAMLVPTTIWQISIIIRLSARFERFPLHCEMMSRFKSEAALAMWRNGLQTAGRTMLIRTHRILSKGHQI